MNWFDRFRRNWLNGFHLHYGRLHDGRTVIFRLYGLMPWFQMSFIDYTMAQVFVDKPAWVRLTLVGKTVFERNREYSGLPNG